MRSPTARAVVTASETSRERALIASSACPMAAKLAAKVTDDLVLDGTTADATKVGDLH